MSHQSIAEQAERKYLTEIQTKINNAITFVDDMAQKQARDLFEQKEYLWENKEGMDRVEKNSVREVVTQIATTGEAVVAKKNRLQKLLGNPYFGRFDFVEKEQSETLPVYIGIHAYYDEKLKENLVHDWRAPISSMFYDFELGNAWYDAPSGKVEGDIHLKRQFRIRNGKMEFMLESSLNIHDDILQKELSGTSSEKMKNIVATIQRDQNSIIRNDRADTLIIQGVAGSGKTSIALHRIAFLLYRFKDTIKASDILIISPNKVFADYISNVLPELGEEKIPEKGMDELASELLKDKYKFQTFFEQVSLLCQKNDADFAERIRFKANFEFINQLNKYIAHVDNHFFKPKNIIFKSKYPVPKWFLEERYKAYHRLPLLKRFDNIVRDVENNILLYYKYEITTTERNDLRTRVKGMFEIMNLREIYKNFFTWIEKPEMFKTTGRSKLEYSDVFPLIYLKMKLEGLTSYHTVKHLLVDEMQDYTPVQYAVLQRIFQCKKTILGDANQSVNVFSSSCSESIQKVFPAAEVMKLNKSYRSTFEITRFAQKISPNAELEVIERHGNEPIVKTVKKKTDEIDVIVDKIKEFGSSKFESLGILCKTEKQAQTLFDQLKEAGCELHLLGINSAAYVNGVIITTVQMAKGLEFDSVIVPQAINENYKTELDKSFLYIACTRAMHELTIIGFKNISEFIKY